MSAIVTTKNEEKNIGRLLKSLKEQTYKNIEIVVVDFDSIDKTKEISMKFTKKVYNTGLERSTQRNYGAKKSIGSYLIFLDADMELTSRAIEDCIDTAKKGDFKAIVIPETTVGKGFVAKVRKFEREMYVGDFEIEVARFFTREIFFKFGGYDPRLTGPEDYDLPYRISKKYPIGRSHEYILHHEEEMTLGKLLKKKYYYANRGALYAQKHPELILKQGTIIFRKAYIKHWKKFLSNPLLGIAFIFIRILETVWAIRGYIKAVGFGGFLRTATGLLKRGRYASLKIRHSIFL